MPGCHGGKQNAQKDVVAKSVVIVTIGDGAPQIAEAVQVWQHGPSHTIPPQTLVGAAHVPEDPAENGMTFDMHD
jgi:hypothetical protein